MNNDILHIIMTRFNLALSKKLWALKEKAVDLELKARANKYLGTSEEWMDHRLEIFERYCFPSIANQTNQNFKWLILCDPQETLPRHEEKLKTFSRPNIFITAASSTDPFDGMVDLSKGVRGGWGKIVKDIIKLADSEDYQYLLTTRLDNDDALNVLYIDYMQTKMLDKFKQGEGDLLINLEGGVKLDTNTGQYYMSRMHNSQFQTLIEEISIRKTPIRTVMGLGNHSTAHQRCKTYQDKDFLGWLQVIHPRNIHNRIKPGDKLLSNPAGDMFGIEVKIEHSS